MATGSISSAMEYPAKSERKHPVLVWTADENRPCSSSCQPFIPFRGMNNWSSYRPWVFTEPLPNNIGSFRLKSWGIDSKLLVGAARVQHTIDTLVGCGHIGSNVPHRFHANIPPWSGDRRPYDRTIGLQRMQQVGAFMTTAEQVAFQLAQSSEHPQ